MHCMIPVFYALWRKWPQVILLTLFSTVCSILFNPSSIKASEKRSRTRKTASPEHREQEASDSAQLAVHLSEWAAQGDWRLYFLYRDRLEQVTANDVNRVARLYLEPSNRTVGIYYPTKEAQRTTIPPTPKLDEMIGEYKGRANASVGEAFDVNPANRSPDKTNGH